MERTLHLMNKFLYLKHIDKFFGYLENKARTKTQQKRQHNSKQLHGFLVQASCEEWSRLQLRAENLPEIKSRIEPPRGF